MLHGLAPYAIAGIAGSGLVVSHWQDSEQRLALLSGTLHSPDVTDLGQGWSAIGLPRGALGFDAQQADRTSPFDSMEFRVARVLVSGESELVTVPPVGDIVSGAVELPSLGLVWALVGNNPNESQPRLASRDGTLTDLPAATRKIVGWGKDRLVAMDHDQAALVVVDAISLPSLRRTVFVSWDTTLGPIRASPVSDRTSSCQRHLRTWRDWTTPGRDWRFLKVWLPTT